MRIAPVLSLLFSLSLSASTLEECAAGCNIWTWGPSDSTLTTLVRQAETPGDWNGHAGVFLYEDYILNLAPYQWIAVGTYTGPGPLGAPVETGSKNYPDQWEWRDGVWFFWYDPGFELDPLHGHLELVTPPVHRPVSERIHSIGLWQCLDGIVPPEPPYPFESPEPGTLTITALALAALVWNATVRMSSKSP